MDYIGLKIQACVQECPIENIKDQKVKKKVKWHWYNKRGLAHLLE